MKPITDIEVARNLPERDSYRVLKRAQTDGRLLEVLEFPELVAVEKDDRAILLFEDRDGRFMTVGYDSDGAYKSPVEEGSMGVKAKDFLQKKFKFVNSVGAKHREPFPTIYYLCSIENLEIGFKAYVPKGESVEDAEKALRSLLIVDDWSRELDLSLRATELIGVLDLKRRITPSRK